MTQPLSLWPWRMAPNARPAITHIAAQVAEDHGMTLDELRSRTRRRPVVRARVAAMRRMAETGRGANAIARYFNLHWSVVSHHLRKEQDAQAGL